MDVYEFLALGKEEISDQEKWCTRALAIDNDGYSVPPISEDAVKWCATGILQKIEHDTRQFGLASLARERLNKSRVVKSVRADLPDAPLNIGIEWVNDNCQHRAVMDAFDQAMKVTWRDKLQLMVSRLFRERSEI